MSEVQNSFGRIGESPSVFLKQSSSELVQWNSWTDEVFEAARDREKPIFLSVGRAGCLWSRRMTEESFDDSETADFLNANFICVKLDCNERPDIAEVYAELVKAMTGGSAGLPLTVFLTPERLPFLGGTYFPRKASFGTPAFLDVCAAAVKMFAEDKEHLNSAALLLVGKLKESALESSLGKLEADLSDSALNPEKIRNSLSGAIADLKNYFRETDSDGVKGSGDFQKTFFSGRLHAMLFSGDKKILAVALSILDRLRCGAMTDSVDGGVFGPAPDFRFGSLSFIKTLAGNAQLLSLYAYGSLALKRSNPEKSDDFRTRSGEIFEWLSARLRSPQSGLFYSSEFLVTDEHDECAYSYSFSDISKLFWDKPEELEFALSFFGVSKNGNFNGRNLLVRPASLSEFCRERGITPEQGQKRLLSCLALLRDFRDGREAAQPDGLIVLSENALLASHVMRAAQAFGNSSWMEMGLAQLEKIWSTFFDGREKPARLFSQGFASGQAIADDLGFSLQAFVDAYCATGKTIYAQRACQTVKWLHTLCVDPAAGLLYLSSQSSELLLRPLRWADDSCPSYAAVIFESCRTYLAVCTSAGTLSAMEPSVVKMWEALELVALATFATHARQTPKLCASGLSALKWSAHQLVCIIEAEESVRPEDWLSVSSTFWSECLAAGGQRVVLSQWPQHDELAADSKPSETLKPLPALTLCTARGRYESTVKYSEIIDQIRIHSDSEG
jgi:hypothetical protein